MKWNVMNLHKIVIKCGGNSIGLQFKNVKVATAEAFTPVAVKPLN